MPGFSSISPLPMVFDAFGNGVDGDVTISANTTLTRDMHYNNLTVDATFTLTTASFKIFCKNTLINNGTISNKGLTATDSTGAAAIPSKTLGGSSKGGSSTGHGGGGGSGGGIIIISTKNLQNNGTITVVGGNGANGASGASVSTNGVAGDAITLSIGAAGGAGGTTGGAGGSLTIPLSRPNSYAQASMGLSGLDGYYNGGSGGGSGGRTSAGAAGGGGGGGGGALILIYLTAILGTLVVTGGTAGSGVDGGAGGANGSNGNTYTVVPS